ncbi:uncharacterized protein LOC144375652 [Ictidomys tridecemlineatus]
MPLPPFAGTVHAGPRGRVPSRLPAPRLPQRARLPDCNFGGTVAPRAPPRPGPPRPRLPPPRPGYAPPRASSLTRSSSFPPLGSELGVAGRPLPAFLSLALLPLAAAALRLPGSWRCGEGDGQAAGRRQVQQRERCLQIDSLLLSSPATSSRPNSKESGPWELMVLGKSIMNLPLRRLRC